MQGIKEHNRLESREDFESALKQALKDYARPDLLSDNPLIDSALVSAESGQHADPLVKAQTLRRIIAKCAEEISQSPKLAIYHQVLQATYFRPATNQEAAARQLGLAYSTFRRYLGNARRLISADLWLSEKELHHGS